VSDRDEHVGPILAIAREVLSRPGITADDELRENGGTSLSITLIIARTSRALGLEIDPADISGAVTAASLAQAARQASRLLAGRAGRVPASGPGSSCVLRAAPDGWKWLARSVR
jgi:acyl carrier protein